MNKKSNVYHQSIVRQLTFLGVGAYFSSTALLIPNNSEDGTEEWNDALSSMLMIALILEWYGTYGVLFDQLRKAYRKALQLTTEFRKKTTFLMSTSDYLTEDDNKGFSFDIENNIEIWWRMREHIYLTTVDHSQYHNATMEGFIVIIVLNAVVLLTMSFMKAADMHLAVYVYLFSLEALLTATIIKHLRSSVRINK